MDTKRTLWYLLLFLCAFLSILCQTGARKMRHNDGTGQHNYILRNELDPEKVTVDVFEPVDGREAEEQFKSDVDEELVRKAETAADEDLLGGLNMILDKNETLEDVMRAEGIGQIP